MTQFRTARVSRCIDYPASKKLANKGMFQKLFSIYDIYYMLPQEDIQASKQKHS